MCEFVEVLVAQAGLPALPTWVYPAAGGAAIFFILFMVLMMRRAFRKARSVGQSYKAGLERLGLRTTQESKAGAKMEGSFRGYPVAMETDGSAIMRTANAAMLKGAIGAVVGETGIGGDHAQWYYKHETSMARHRMQDAQMFLRWSVTLPRAASVSMQIEKKKSAGFEPIGARLFAKFDGEAPPALSDPSLQSALSAATFDFINVGENTIEAIWAPAMRQYQKVASSSDEFAGITEKSLVALTELSSKLVGPP